MSVKDKIEDHLGLVIGGIALASAAAGFGAYRGLLEVTNQTTLVRGTYYLADDVKADYTPRAEVERAYISRDDVAAKYLPLDEVKASYVALEVVNQEYVPKASCAAALSFGFSQEKLAARLLELLQPRSEDEIKRITLIDRCAGPFVTPEAKVEILAYLTSGERGLRSKAVLAYANCAGSVNEAFLLARTIKEREALEHFDAYAFGLWVIIKNKGLAIDMSRMQSYLLEIGAPRGLVSAFWARASGETPGDARESVRPPY